MNSGQDRDSNVARACQLIDEVSPDSPDLVVLPEYFNNFFFVQYRNYEYMKLAERDDGYTMTQIKAKARQYNFHIIATIYEEESPGIYYDSAMIINPEGEIIGKYRKTHPGAYRGLEKIYFRYGSKYPVFQIHDWRVGIVICYDLFFPESVRCSVLNGSELVIVPFAAPAGYLSPNSSSVPEETGRRTIMKKDWLHRWDALMTTRAFENVVYLAPCNHVGREGDAVFIGGTRVVSPLGNTIAEAGDEERKIVVELERELFLSNRRTSPLLRDRRPDLYRGITTETDIHTFT
jgi:N-carbamoylputrescine amidase